MPSLMKRNSTTTNVIAPLTNIVIDNQPTENIIPLLSSRTDTTIIPVSTDTNEKSIESFAV